MARIAHNPPAPPTKQPPIKYPPQPGPTKLPPVVNNRNFPIDDVRWTFSAIDGLDSKQTGKISRDDIKAFLQHLDSNCHCYTSDQVKKLKEIARFLLEKFDAIDKQNCPDCYLEISEILCTAGNDGNDCFLGDPDFCAPGHGSPAPAPGPGPYIPNGHSTPWGGPFIEPPVIRFPLPGSGSGHTGGSGGNCPPSNGGGFFILDGYGGGQDFTGNPISGGAPAGSTHPINHLDGK